MKKNNEWMKFRHRVVTAALRPFFKAYMKIRCRVDAQPFKEQGHRQYLVLMNHQTAFDQFFVAASFKKPVYYIATEDIFSLGWISAALRWLVAPIPIKKQTMDIQAVKNCIKVAKEGGTIALAPEGNRTYSGRTGYIKPGIISLIKKLGLPIAIYHIEGGYGVQPRWSDVIRKGHMKAYVSRVIEPEEAAAMPGDELYEMICSELYIDEAVADGEFHHKNTAEYLERAIYVCPYCGLSTFESRGDIIECTKCGIKVKYLPTKELRGEGFEFPYRFAGDWYTYQCDYINSLDIDGLKSEVDYSEKAGLWNVVVYKNKYKTADSLTIRLKGDRITVGDDLVFDFDETDAVTVLGKNKVNIYHKGKVYQLKGNERFNALKYVNIFNRYRNIREGNSNVEFLGL